MNRRDWLVANRRGLIGMGAFVVVAVITATALAISGLVSNLGRTGKFVQPPEVAMEAPSAAYADKALFADPGSQTAAAAASDPRFADLAQTPTAKWFTDWAGNDQIESALDSYITAAAGANQLPVAVLYRIPDRDCGGYSTGGAADAEEYLEWVEGAARAVKGRPVMILVEPDAIGQLHSCSDERVETLRSAVDILSQTGAWIYLDAGHSAWRSANEIAKALEEVGVSKTRGFFTNVANYRPTADEQAFAERVVNALRDRGIAEVRYLIDTGRNGAELPHLSHCNEFGARIGAKPELRFEGHLDGFLWIKVPAESDGKCHGGPTSGFFAPLALSLLGYETGHD